MKYHSLFCWIFLICSMNLGLIFLSFLSLKGALSLEQAYLSVMNQSLMSEIRWDKSKCKCLHILTQSCYQIVGGWPMKTKGPFVCHKSDKLEVSLTVKRRRKKRYKIMRFALIAIILILLWKYYRKESNDQIGGSL